MRTQPGARVKHSRHEPRPSLFFFLFNKELARIQSTDLVVPTTDGRTVRLRCVVHPDKAQAILLQHLGLTLAKRWRLPRGVARMECQLLRCKCHNHGVL
jgi:hypothetical protein